MSVMATGAGTDWVRATIFSLDWLRCYFMNEPQTLSVDVALKQAVSHHLAGRLYEAEQLYRAILRVQPYQPDANHNLGILAGQIGQQTSGLPYLKTALMIKPSQEQYLLSYADALLAIGRGQEALVLIQDAIERKLNTPKIQKLRQKIESSILNSTANGEVPSFTGTNHLVELFNAGRYGELEKLAHTLVEQYPVLGFGWKALGVSLQMQGKDGVVALYKAAELLPDDAAVHFNLGKALHATGQPESAVAMYRRSLQIKPDDAEAYLNLGNVLKDIGELDNAVESYRHALKIKPDDAELHNSLGNALGDLGKFDEAMACYQRALEIKPDYAVAYSNLGITLKDIGQLGDAVANFRRALEIAPHLVEAYNSLGNALKDLGELDNAVASYRRALEIKPDYIGAYDNLLFAINYHPDMKCEDVFEVYREYEKRFGLFHPRIWNDNRDKGNTRRRLKIGYVSPDFRLHSCRHFLEPLLHNHDKSAFEIYAYAELAKEDEVTARYKRYVDHWVSTRGMSDDALCERICTDGIDILVDLAGHTANNRLTVFARKPAPVSLSWLGFGYTTGLSAIDYLLTDVICAPEGSEKLFSEIPWRLETPGYVYRPAEGMGAVSSLPAIMRGHISFGTLTRAVRINHRTIRVWSEILKRVEGARLIIDSSNFQMASIQAALAEKFMDYGIERERLEIGYHSPPWDTMRNIDIGLDCFPHNSGTTLFETLYMGIPFITLADRPSVGRLGSSILEGLGHPEWIAQSEDEYIEMAVALALNLPKLADLRSRLRKEMETGPLMDEVGFANKVEEAYRNMFGKWVARQSQKN